MFQVWLEDLLELTDSPFVYINPLTRWMQQHYAGSRFCHSDRYIRFCYFFDM